VICRARRRSGCCAWPAGELQRAWICARYGARALHDVTRHYAGQLEAEDLELLLVASLDELWVITGLPDSGPERGPAELAPAPPRRSKGRRR